MLNNRAVGEIKIISKYCVSITRYNRMAGNFFYNGGVFPYPGRLRKKNIPDFQKAHFITLKNGGPWCFGKIRSLSDQYF